MDSRKDYSAALALRMQGKTYGEIRRVFGIPKSTQSTWFKDLELPKTAQEILASKHRAGLAALEKFNRSRTLSNQIQNENIRSAYEKSVSSITDRELMLIGAALYWGEGYKNFGKPKYVQVSMANSDPSMVLIFTQFLKRVLKVPIEKVKATVMIHKNIVPSNALNYWKSTLPLPEENFRVQRFVSSASKNVRPKNTLPYGTLQLRVSKRQEFFKIRGMIDGIIKTIE